MTNDRFSAQLRQHLLTTADEQPAASQLAAVADRVARTGQRHTLVARLTWFPGRIGPFPSAALRFSLVALALVLAAMASAILGGGAPQGRTTVFEGTWTSIDPGDGSTQTLAVGPGSSPALHYVDQFATGPACQAATVKVFTADGRGTITGNRLVASFPDGGGCDLLKVEIALRLDYDAGSGALRDQDGVIWTRVTGAVLLPTREPDTSPASESPSPSPRPSPRPGDATFTSTLHGITLDVPAAWRVRPATEPWTGGALGFDSPAADVIFDPARGDHLYLLIATQPYGSLTADQWRDAVLAWTCTDGEHEMWGWHVDGFYSWQQGPCNSGSIVQTPTRGYLIRLVASSTEPGLAHTYDWDWLKPVLETVDLRP